MEHRSLFANSQKTIFVVDDDPHVRSFVEGFLVNVNYNVLTAESGEAALQLSRTYIGDIDLLLSDFRMPEMNGMDLALQMSLERSNLKVLLMSGFTDGMLVLNEGWHFLPKPFIASQLCELLSNVISSPKELRRA